MGASVAVSTAVQDWNKSKDVGDQAVASVKRFLMSPKAEGWLHVREIFDVCDKRVYQKKDIDLLVMIRSLGWLALTKIEVKGDKRDDTGNFFFETVSDVERDTTGAFLLTEADWFLYYFINTKVLYCIPMFRAREWFCQNIKKFPVGYSESNKYDRTWKTKGRLVNIRMLLRAVPETKEFRL